MISGNIFNGPKSTRYVSDNDILDGLPLGREAILLDRITHLTASSITAEAKLKSIEGHFKDVEIIPGSVLLEVAGQAALALIKKSVDSEKDILLYSNNASFIHPVYPNELIKIESNIVEKRENKVTCKIVINKGSNCVMTGGITLAIVNRDRWHR